MNECRKYAAADINSVSQLPLYVLLVDISSNDDSEGYIELIKTALLASIEAIYEQCSILLITYSDSINVYNLHSNSIAHYKSTAITAENHSNNNNSNPSYNNTTGHIEIPLKSLFPLHISIDKLMNIRENLSIAIESIQGSNSPCRAYGAVLDAIFDYCSASYSTIRIVSFLAGIPNYGIGALNEARLTQIKAQ